MLLPLSSLGESEVQRGFAQVHNSGSPVKHRAGLPSPPLHFLLSLMTDYSSLLLGSQSHQHHFQMEISPSQPLPPLPWRLETGRGSIMMTRSWPGVSGPEPNLVFVDLMSISWLCDIGQLLLAASCKFLMCKKKMILLAGWVAKPSHSVSLAQAFNLDSTSRSGPIQSLGHVGDS